VRFLNRWFQEEQPVPDQGAPAVFARTEKMDVSASAVITALALSGFLCRVDCNKSIGRRGWPWGARHDR
jgi:hypothetical protein